MTLISWKEKSQSPLPEATRAAQGQATLLFHFTKELEYSFLSFTTEKCNLTIVTWEHYLGYLLGFFVATNFTILYNQRGKVEKIPHYPPLMVASQVIPPTRIFKCSTRVCKGCNQQGRPARTTNSTSYYFYPK